MSGEIPAISAQRAIGELPATLCQVTGWDECIAALRAGKQAAFDSVWGSSCALLAAALSREGFDSVLIVLPTDKELDSNVDDLLTFNQAYFSSLKLNQLPIARFPACPNLGSAELSTDEHYGQRLRLLREISDGKLPPVIFTSIAGLLQAVPRPYAFSANARMLRVGAGINLEEFRSWLQASGFQSTFAVELPGEFSFRGGIIDIYPPDALQPLRVELFDDLIESIRVFDVATQRSIQKCQEVELSCLPIPQSTTPIGEPSPKTPGQLDWASLLEYLPSNSLVLLVEPNEIYQEAQQQLERATSSFNLISFDDLRAVWARFPLASASRMAIGQFEPQCRLPIESLGHFSGDLSEVRFELERLSLDQQVYLVTNSEAEAHRVGEILKQTQAATTGRLHLTTGYLHEGFRLRHVQSIALGCDQLFQRSDLRRSWRRRPSRKLESFTELKNGDLVVHVTHGIGRFRGLRLLDHNLNASGSPANLPIEQNRSEHLEIEFAGGAKIFVPVNKIGLIQKYVGATKKTPRLAKIGGKSWARQKHEAEQAVNDLALEMLELQAVRASKPGIEFAEDSEWQFEFEHSFPYRETPDQSTAIEAIKQDMMSPKPMDRLLCGDVGFGKTEVAMRAAFKAVESGYQVAILVPTTVLAEQHFKTFRERMAEFPVTIDRLSRFASPANQRATIEKLKAGSVDIIIGTHRLVSKDVTFKNLGLIVIDEEQRFGVGVKERLKQLRREVDVLTMSATPIPRTLHMSLVGVRDISNLTTPPEDRMPVETKVTRFDESLIREAAMRELGRGGQIYFVHNRVMDIQVVKHKLVSIIPEARIIVGHGQMNEFELEKAMTEFVAGNYDVLLATTIIENGLDIPNANTIFINLGDRLGLSELHQLRGRVGRYKHRAYCYVMVDPQKHLTPVAAKRLQAIEHFSQMGAGFQIAMRDLEIRGAGNLLGAEQSGHISMVGYEMYCQLLETAVRKLKQMPAKLSVDVDIELPIDAYVPDDYIADRTQKVEFYRRIYALSSFDSLIDLRRETRDRFGPLPTPVKRLIKLAEIKLEAAIWQVDSILITENRYLGMHFKDKNRMQQLVSQSKLPLRPTDDSTVYLTLNRELISPDNLLNLLQSILRTQ